MEMRLFLLSWQLWVVDIRCSERCVGKWKMQLQAEFISDSVSETYQRFLEAEDQRVELPPPPPPWPPVHWKVDSEPWISYESLGTRQTRRRVTWYHWRNIQSRATTTITSSMRQRSSGIIMRRYSRKVMSLLTEVGPHPTKVKRCLWMQGLHYKFIENSSFDTLYDCVCMYLMSSNSSIFFVCVFWMLRNLMHVSAMIWTQSFSSIFRYSLRSMICRGFWFGPGNGGIWYVSLPWKYITLLLLFFILW